MDMLRFYLRLILLPLVLFSAALLLIHAQPYDDHELRELLLPEGCPAPCFMGIRPGITRTKAALKSLVTGQWADLDLSSIRVDALHNPFLIQLNNVPSHFTDSDSRLELKTHSDTPDLVTEVTFQGPSRMTVGDVYLVLGKPSLYTVISGTLSGSGSYASMGIYHWYNGLSLIVHTVSDCPVSISDLLHEPIYQIYYFDQLGTVLPNSMPSLNSVLRYPNCG